MRNKTEAEKRQRWIKDHLLTNPGTFGEIYEARKKFVGAEEIETRRTLSRDLAAMRERKEITIEGSGIYHASGAVSVYSREQALAHSNKMVAECLPNGDTVEGTKLMMATDNQEIGLHILERICLDKSPLLYQHLHTGYYSVFEGWLFFNDFKETYREYYIEVGLDHHALRSLFLELPQSNIIKENLENQIGREQTDLFEGTLQDAAIELSKIAGRLKYGGVPMQGICSVCVDPKSVYPHGA